MTAEDFSWLLSRPKWIRWILILPSYIASVVVGQIVATIIAFFWRGWVPDWVGALIGQTLASLFGGFLVVLIAEKLAPSHKLAVGIASACFSLAFAVALVPRALTSADPNSPFPTWVSAIELGAFFLASAYAVYYLQQKVVPDICEEP